MRVLRVILFTILFMQVATLVSIAAGMPMTPAPSQPMPSPPATPSSASPSPPISSPAPSVLAPSNSSSNLPTGISGKGTADASKLPARVTIEYSQSLAPVSNQPGLSVVEALNEALKNSPRASAIRSHLAIARSGYAAATQAPNPNLFMDRGLMAEQVMRPWPSFY